MIEPDPQTLGPLPEPPEAPEPAPEPTEEPSGPCPPEPPRDDDVA